MTLAQAVLTILKGQGLVKLERLFREIPEGLNKQDQYKAELNAVSRQYSGLSASARSSLARITRDSVAFNTRIMEGGKSKAGLRSGIPVVEGLSFNDANSAQIRYSVAVDIFDPATGVRKYITPNILSNKALTLQDLIDIINQRITGDLQGSPGLKKVLEQSNPTVEEIHRVLALRNS